MARVWTEVRRNHWLFVWWINNLDGSSPFIILPIFLFRQKQTIVWVLEVDLTCCSGSAVWQFKFIDCTYFQLIPIKVFFWQQYPEIITVANLTFLAIFGGHLINPPWRCTTSTTSTFRDILINAKYHITTDCCEKQIEVLRGQLKSHMLLSSSLFAKWSVSSYWAEILVILVPTCCPI